MGALELRELVKYYGIGSAVVRAVDGVSMTVEAGEIVAVYGPSGSGKTTLLLLAAGLLKPDAGKVCFDGRDLAVLSKRESALYRRRDVGIVLQTFHLGPARALDSAAFKMLADNYSLAEGRRAARPWLKRVGLSEREGHRPEELSMGERQRVAIARALVNEPRLLLADEPTGNLDAQRSDEILRLLCEICHERRIPGLVVTHDPLAAALVDRVYSVRDGRLIPGLDRASSYAPAG